MIAFDDCGSSETQKALRIDLATEHSKKVPIMEMRKLGSSGLKIAPLMFGGNVLGWTADEAMSFRLLDRFVDAGLNAIDTADVYSKWVPGHKGGESEAVIGKWLKARGNRSRVVIATKVGLELPGVGQGLRKDYILQRVEDSLERLQTDYIDLYQSHTDDKKAPLEETLGAYQRLIEQGKVKAIGASNYDASRLAEALKVSAEKKLPRYETLQPHYNLYERADYERALEPLVLKEGIGVIPYYALASGFLTGKYRSEADLKKSVRGGGAKSKLNPRGFRILGALDAVAARLGATPAQVALAWLMARPGITAPIASATSPDQLEDLIASVRLKLDPDAVAALDAASAP
jgi:aryl-alcohol dehydrogenase-like predicted oxidoreductase